MKNGMNMSSLKQRNRAMVLSIVNAEGPISRIDIAHEMGLTAAALTQITGGMLQEGVLKETGKQELPSAGRRKVLLQLNEDYRLPVCVNVDREQTVITICSLKGDVKAQKILPTSVTKPIAFLEDIAQQITILKNHVPKEERAAVQGISVGMAGAIDRDNGVSLKEGGIFGQDVKVREILEASTGMPVILENNVDAFAQAELLFGNCRNEKNLLVIKWGPGVGSAVLLQRELYEGKGRQAELGHIQYPDGTSLEDHINARVLRTKSRKEKEDAAKILALAVVNACMLLSPDHVILYGTLAGKDSDAEMVMAEVRKRDPSVAICTSALADKEDWIGECAVYLKQEVF